MLEERIERYWTGRATGYSSSIIYEMQSFKRNAWRSLIKSFAGENKTLKVLDVGTGPGFFAILMAELGHEVTAVDTSSDMLKEAKRNADYAGFEIKFITGDAQNIDLPAGSFDLIVSRNLVWTLPTPLETYQEWYRLLNTTGRVLVFDANWYLRLSDDKLQQKYEYCKSKAREMGFTEKFTNEQHRECEAIAKKLPLTYKKRPAWDKEAFIKCGFRDIVIENNINNLIYDDREKIIYEATPMFAICAAKGNLEVN